MNDHAQAPAVSPSVEQRPEASPSPAPSLAPAGVAPSLIQRKIARRAVQRQTTAAGQATGQAADITPEEAMAAVAWAGREHPAQAFVRDLQTQLGVAVSGNYDEATARAVYARQRQLQPRGAIAHAGQAGPEFCRRIGLIFYREAQDAAVGDAELDDIRRRFPSGLTVALYAGYAETGNNAEFGRKAREFATNQHAVGLDGGAVRIGVPVRIVELTDVMTTVNSIHQGLLAKWRASQAAQGANGQGANGQGAGGQGAGGQGAAATAEPAFVKIKNLALFAHGEGWGIGMNARNDFSVGGVHNNRTRDLYPSNVEAFARSLQAGVTADVRVQLFACSSASDTNARSQAWLEHEQGARFGQNSFAQSLATSLGPQASVAAHTTVGHTTENYAARVFGAEAGGGQGGLHMFDILYPESFIQSELARLFPDKTEEERAALHDPLREKMWAHYRASADMRGSLHGEYSIPIGQEMFINPTHAAEVLHAHYTTWITRNMPVAPRPRRPTGRS